jgi:hypothetical protein
MKPIAQERDLYVALEAGQYQPTRPELIELLQNLPGAVWAQTRNANLEIAALMLNWGKCLERGDVGGLLSAIELLPQALDANKPFLRVQALHQALILGEALRSLEHLL